jgi:hypothetical protein
MRVFFVVTLSIIGLLLPGLLIVAGLAGGSPLTAVFGALTLGLVLGLGWMIYSGQKRLRTMMRAIAEETGLTLSESPDLVPGPAHLTLVGKVGGRWVSTAFENLPVAGTTEYQAGGGKWHVSRKRQHLVARVRVPSIPGGGKGEWINLDLTARLSGAGGGLSEENVTWLRERGCRKFQLSSGSAAMAWDSRMTEEGLREVARGITLLVEFVDRLESGSERGGERPHSCPICGAAMAFNPRYPRAVCPGCVSRACDAEGRELDFFNADFGGGYLAVYREGGGNYDSHDCFIDALPCRADEARFGGIVVQLSESNQSRDFASRSNG